MTKRRVLIVEFNAETTDDFIRHCADLFAALPHAIGVTIDRNYQDNMAARIQPAYDHLQHALELLRLAQRE